MDGLLAPHFGQDFAYETTGRVLATTTRSEFVGHLAVPSGRVLRSATEHLALSRPKGPCDTRPFGVVQSCVRGSPHRNRITPP